MALAVIADKRVVTQKQNGVAVDCVYAMEDTQPSLSIQVLRNCLACVILVNLHMSMCVYEENYIYFFLFDFCLCNRLRESGIHSDFTRWLSSCNKKLLSFFFNRKNN